MTEAQKVTDQLLDVDGQLQGLRERIFGLGNPERSAIGLDEVNKILAELDNIEQFILSAMDRHWALSLDAWLHHENKLEQLRKNLHINVSDAIALGNCSAPKGCLKVVRTWH